MRSATEPLSLLLWHLGRRGGGPRYTLELARSLREREDVRLCLALSEQSELFAETKALGLPTLGIRTYHSAAGFAAGLLRLPTIAANLRRFVAGNKVDIALSTMVGLWNPPLVGAIKKGGALNALVVHDAAPHPGDNHLVRNAMLRNDFRQADLLVALTDSVSGRLQQEQGVPADKIIQSRLGPFRYAAAPPKPRRLGGGPHRLLFFGRLLPYKGIEILIAAMESLAAKDFPVKLTIVGQGPLDPGPLPSNVVLDRRWVAEADIPDLFAATDLVVLPYQEASQSGVLPIARDLAVPAIVTPVGGLIEQVEQGRLGFISPDLSAEALAETIFRVASDSAGYAAMSARLAEAGSDKEWKEISGLLIENLRLRRP